MRSITLLFFASLLTTGYAQQTTRVDRSEVTFRLWTRSLQNYVLLNYGQVENAAIILDQPFKFIIHGYTHNADKEWVTLMKDEYLKKANLNVILVDWRGPAFNPIYPISAANTREVGKYLGELLIDLNNTIGIPYENFHLIGHSLGAHVSGFAGQTTILEAGKVIGRITGMDPAGPEFFPCDADDRLSEDDSQYVDVIHTDKLKLGYPVNIGHIDFYPQGGASPQPGCLLYDASITWAGCCHVRAYVLFTESINSFRFVSNQCSSYMDYILSKCFNTPSTLMGENIKIGIRGTFYLNTNHASPYAKNGSL